MSSWAVSRDTSPRYGKGGLVLMDIAREVSDVTRTTTSGIDQPTIQQRKFNSSGSVQIEGN